MFPNERIVALTVTATEKTTDIISNSLEIVDPHHIIEGNSNRKNIFYTATRYHKHEIEASLLPYIAKLKELREMSLTVLHSKLEICGERRSRYL